MSWSTAGSRLPEPGASCWRSRRSRLPTSKAAGTEHSDQNLINAILDPRISVRRALARRVFSGQRGDGRQRRLAGRPCHREHLAAVVASRALYAAARPGGTLHPLCLVRQQVLVALLL